MGSRLPPPERNWKVFVNERPRAVNGLYASINQIGKIVLNRRANEALGKPEAVSLMFDEATSTIGLRACLPFGRTSFPLAQRAGGNALVWARPFAKANDLRIEYTVKFLDPHMEGGVLILDLNLTTRATQSPRTGWRKKREVGSQTG